MVCAALISVFGMLFVVAAPESVRVSPTFRFETAKAGETRSALSETKA
jgi:hypothetical protein